MTHNSRSSEVLHLTFIGCLSMSPITVGKRSSSLFGNDEDNWCVLYSIDHYEETYYWHFLSY